MGWNFIRVILLKKDEKIPGIISETIRNKIKPIWNKKEFLRGNCIGKIFYEDEMVQRKLLEEEEEFELG